MGVLVSVIIPSYNVSSFISESIQSVFSQFYSPVELICVDNGSTDDTLKTLKELGEKYNFIVLTEPKRGANAARNAGLRHASGKWVQFLDADDLLLPYKISRQMDLVKLFPDVAFVVGSYLKEDDRGRRRLVKASDNPHTASFFNLCGITSSNLWKKTSIEAVGGWDEAIQSSQETDLMFRLILRDFTYARDQQAGTVVRERPGQISRSNPKRRIEQYINVRLDYLEKLRTEHPEVYEKNATDFYEFLAVSILSLGEVDPSLAQEYYHKVLPHTWRPDGKFGFSRHKKKLIDFLGFSNYLRLLRLFKKRFSNSPVKV